MTKRNPKKPNSAVRVSRAVQTERGETFALVTNGEREHWVALADIVLSKSKVFAELASAGMPLLSSKTQAGLIKQLENHPEPKPAIVATQPGWIADTVYVHSNGEFQTGKSDEAEIIVSFLPDSAYGSSGTLDEWKAAFAPLLRKQRLMTFLMGYGFSALLIAKLQPSPQNPIVEIFGTREAGKTTAAMGVGSIYGGDPDGNIGIGRTADATLASFKPVQRMAHDTLLFLDETNIIDKNIEQNLRLFFDHTSGDERMRYGATDRKQSIRNTLILTGNERLVDRTKTNSKILDAARSRCLSIDVGNMVFQGQDISRAENIKKLMVLRSASTNFYGTASRAYVARIIEGCEVDKDAFAKRVAKLMANFQDDLPPAPELPNRIRSTIALSYAAGRLAHT